jgi:acetyl-CoA C-acetyltransferase
MTSLAPTPSPEDVVIVAAARTPQGKLKGQFASLNAVALGAAAAEAAIERSGLKAEDIDGVLFGQVLQAGAGQNPARQTALAAGVPISVPAATINKVCLSGLLAVIDAARMIRVGDAEVMLAGGQESMTHAPHLLTGSRAGYTYGDIKALDAMARDGLEDAFEVGTSMGALTERDVTKLEITRLEQDTIAAQSHQRAAAAWAEGLFADEIAAVSIPQRKGDPIVVTEDEGVRGDTTTEVLAKLRPAFNAEGSITAGNSSTISDGAAAVMLTTRARAEKDGLTILATVGAIGPVAGPDTSLPSQPSRSIAKALEKAGWEIDDLDFLEINEAFAAVAHQSMKELGVDPEIVNIHGGGISLGHPIGASGARLVVHAAHELHRRGSGRAAVALCGGGGQGESLLLWR